LGLDEMWRKRGGKGGINRLKKSGLKNSVGKEEVLSSYGEGRVERKKASPPRNQVRIEMRFSVEKGGRTSISQSDGHLKKKVARRRNIGETQKLEKKKHLINHHEGVWSREKDLRKGALNSPI